MINAKAYKNYFGGKSGNGTYQTIINHIPPHDVFYSLFLGNCGITRHIKPAKLNILNDIDPEVIQAWEKLKLPAYYSLRNENAIDILRSSIAQNFDTAVKKFFYLDPPYRLSSRKSQIKVYNFEMTDNDHSDLLSQIVTMKDDLIMISHYPDPMYNEALKGWHTKDFYSMIRNGLALERIYYNYTLTDKLHDYSYIGNDFREREKNNRIKNNMLKKIKHLPPQLRNSIIQDLIEK